MCVCVCVCVLVTQSRLTLYTFRHYYFYIIWPVLTFPLYWFPLPPIFNVIFFLSVDVCMCVCWRRQWHPTPVLLPGKSHGQRSLVGCSPWGCLESDMTEWLHFHFSLSCIGEGNDNQLQCSCLENPRDMAAWWAAVDGVAQGRTRLKWLSSSSSMCVCVCVYVNHLKCFLDQDWV